MTAWAVAAGAGDRAALVSFIHATQRDVVRFLAHLNGPQSSEDLAQETYLRAIPALSRFAAEASARTWLLSIARRVAADDVRRARRRPRSRLMDAEDAPGRRAFGAQPSAEGEVLLRLLVEDLDPARREAFVLTQVLGLGYAEAAEVCDCPVGTIRSRVARARVDLIAALGPAVRGNREA